MSRPLYSLGMVTGPPKLPPKVLKGSGSLDGEIQNGGIQSAVLKIFERTAVQLIGSTLCGEGHIAYLSELRIVVECRHFHLVDAFKRWVGVLQRAVVTDVSGGNSIHRKASLGRRRPANRDISLRVPCYLGGHGEGRQRTARDGPGVDRQLSNVLVRNRMVEGCIFGIHQRRIGANFHRRGRCRHAEGNGKAEFLAGFEGGVNDDVGESGVLHSDSVVAGLQVLKEEVAGGAGGGLALIAFVEGMRGDGSALDDGSGNVGDGADGCCRTWIGRGQWTRRWPAAERAAP